MTGTDGELEYVDYGVEAGVATLRLERPEKKNAINAPMREEIVAALNRFAGNDDATVLVVRGSGDSFSAGTDIAELEERIPDTTTEAITLEGFALPEEIEALGKPTIAMIDGIALGGGFELALACDIRIASTEASIGFPEITIGGFPGEGGTQRLPRETNLGTALLLLLTGESISGDRAREYGLVQEVHPPEDIEARTAEIAETIAEKDVPALVLAKLATKLAGRTDLQSGLAVEGLLANVLEATPERRQRLRAFLEG
jgi:enoyl-CoA hydratase